MTASLTELLRQADDLALARDPADALVTAGRDALADLERRVAEARVALEAVVADRLSLDHGFDAIASNLATMGVDRATLDTMVDGRVAVIRKISGLAPLPKQDAPKVEAKAEPAPAPQAATVAAPVLPKPVAPKSEPVARPVEAAPETSPRAAAVEPAKSLPAEPAKVEAPAAAKDVVKYLAPSLDLGSEFVGEAVEAKAVEAGAPALAASPAETPVEDAEVASDTYDESGHGDADDHDHDDGDDGQGPDGFEDADGHSEAAEEAAEEDAVEEAAAEGGVTAESEAVDAVEGHATTDLPEAETVPASDAGQGTLLMDGPEAVEEAPEAADALSLFPEFEPPATDADAAPVESEVASTGSDEGGHEAASPSPVADAGGEAPIPAPKPSPASRVKRPQRTVPGAQPPLASGLDEAFSNVPVVPDAPAEEGAAPGTDEAESEPLAAKEWVPGDAQVFDANVPGGIPGAEEPEAKPVETPALRPAPKPLLAPRPAPSPANEPPFIPDFLG